MTAWKYRDWVIDALNRDLSFRDFTIEQLAGDMLKDATVGRRSRPVSTATASSTRRAASTSRSTASRRSSTASPLPTWLGSTLQCAQCHNHKFDPFPQQDYYRFMAFFDNGEYTVHGQGEEVVDKWLVEPELELATPEQARRREALRREGEDLRFELDKRDLAAELAAFEGAISGPAAAFTTLAPVRFAAKGSSVTSETLADGCSASRASRGKESYTVTVRTHLGGSRRSASRRCRPAPQQGPAARAPLLRADVVLGKEGDGAR